MIVKHTHSVIRTPIDTVNVMGGGGIVAGTITELWGPPGSGKSAYSYDSASMFLEDYPDGVVVVIDPETSTDLVRLEHVFKIDMLRLLIRNAPTLEEGYQVIFKVLGQLDAQMDIRRATPKEEKEEKAAKGEKKPKAPARVNPTVDKFIKEFTLEAAADLINETGAEFDINRIKNAKGAERDAMIAKLSVLLAFYGVLRPPRPTPVLIIWDTIVASKPEAEVQAALAGKNPVNAGGMGLRARINEANLMIIMSNMEGRNLTIYLLNQIRTTGFGTFGGAYDTSSGGNALKHNAHYRLAFRGAGREGTIKKVFDEKLMMNIGTMSLVDVEKSKFGPTTIGIPIFIDDRMGGRIRQKDEAALMCHKLKLLQSSGGPWYTFVGFEEPWTWDRNKLSEGSGRWIEGNPQARMRCLDVLARHYRMNYVTLDTVYKMIGLKLGELNEAQVKYRKDNVENFDFSNIMNQMKADEGNNSVKSS